MADEYAMTHFDSAIALVVRKGVLAERIGGMGRKRLSMGGNAILYQGRILLKMG